MKKTRKSNGTKSVIKGRECYHCRQWLTEENKKTHDCWTTTEEKLTEELSEELKDAWLKLRETALPFGEQRIYASHKSIMFSRKTCYFFVRPHSKRLEVCFFLGRTLKHSEIRKTHPSSKTKVGHIVHVIHSDQVESPLTDWLQEAYTFCGLPKTALTQTKIPQKQSRQKK